MNNQGVRANNGDVTVVLKLVPEILSAHTIMLSIAGQDDEQVITGNDPAIELTNLSHGLHTIEATVFDEENTVLIKAGPVSPRYHNPDGNADRYRDTGRRHYDDGRHRSGTDAG